MIYKFGLLGEYVELSNGKSSPDRNSSALYPVYGSNGFIGFCHGTNAPANTIVIGRVGSYCGSIHFSKNPCWITDNAIRAVAKESEQSRFWFYAMSNYDLHDLRAGSGQPLINQTSLKTLQLPVPNVQTRREISGLLGSLDDKIELNRRMSATLEETARALYRSWFVDFDPVHARARGEAPAHMDPATAALFPDRFGEDGLPEGWELKEVGDLCEIKGGRQLVKDRFNDDGTYPVFGGAGMMGFTDQHNAEGFVITVGRVGAYCGNFVAHRGKAWVNNNASAILPVAKTPSEFLFLALKALDLSTIKKGAAQPFISNGDLKGLTTIMPNEPVLSAFNEEALLLLKRMEACEVENKTLASLRDTLLPKLMSGELRIRAAEARVGEVA